MTDLALACGCLCPCFLTITEGDIVIDCGNEWWESTERRQKRAETFRNGAISWLGVGVSGGYQAARRGPSMSPGGDKQAFEKVKHLLEAWAAKDKNGTPCVQYLGTGGSGHMVKVSPYTLLLKIAQDFATSVFTMGLNKGNLVLFVKSTLCSGLPLSLATMRLGKSLKSGTKLVVLQETTFKTL